MSKNLFKKIALPLFFLGVFLLLYLVWKILDLPPNDELIRIAKEYFEKYGLVTVLISAVIEGLLLIGWYYPGSLVIVLGVIFAGKDLARVVEVVSVIIVGLFVAYIINFFVGKYGWYRLLLAFGLKEPLGNAQRRLTKYGLSAIFVNYWHPNLAALTSTSAGILHFSFKNFFIYSLIATILWSVLGGAFVYFLGEASLSLVDLRFVIIAIIAWIAFRLWFKKSPIEKEFAAKEENC